MTVAELRSLLAMVPDTATVHVVEGQDRGIIIRSADDRRELLFIETRPI